MKLIAATSILALTAGLAGAETIEQHEDFSSNNRTGEPTLNICIELDGLDSWDGAGDASNTIIQQFLGEGSQVVGVKWEDVELTTNGNSFLDEATIGFNDLISVRVGAADNFSGTGLYSSDGIFDFLENDIAYFVEDGNLSLELFETTDDDADGIDSFYSAGKLTVYYIPVPAPSTAALLGFAGLTAVRRRRA